MPHSEIPGSQSGYRLPWAYRRFPRLSSPLDAKTSTARPCSLDHPNPTSFVLAHPGVRSGHSEHVTPFRPCTAAGPAPGLATHRFADRAITSVRFHALTLLFSTFTRLLQSTRNDPPRLRTRLASSPTADGRPGISCQPSGIRLSMSISTRRDQPAGVDRKGLFVPVRCPCEARGSVGNRSERSSIAAGARLKNLDPPLTLSEGIRRVLRVHGVHPQRTCGLPLRVGGRSGLTPKDRVSRPTLGLARSLHRRQGKP